MRMETETADEHLEGVLLEQPLLTPYLMGSLNLSNRIVMSPMTRGRTTSEDRTPIEIEADYYSQRASAGLIVTGGTYISSQAIGAVRVPGIYSEPQVEGWKRVTDAVHERGGRIFLQIAHSGSISHPDLLSGALPVAPSEINPEQQVFTPTGFKETLSPRPLAVDEIKSIVEDYGNAAKNARLAGFDGVELHSANTYLLPQFLSSVLNRREDAYGGSAENRARFVLEALEAIAAHWAKERIGVKLSPGLHGVGAFVANNDTLPTYQYLVRQIDRVGLGYLHITRPSNDVSTTAAAVLQNDTFKHFRPLFKGTLIANTGFDQATANEVLRAGNADLVSFARHFIANPDLSERFAERIPLAESDRTTYYQGGVEGYTTYPTYASREQ
jgi:N-ethylmaleimide reductase